MSEVHTGVDIDHASTILIENRPEEPLIRFFVRARLPTLMLLFDPAPIETYERRRARSSREESALR